MGELVTVVGGAEATALANLSAYAAQARGAHAPNTERAIRADTAIFTAWCSDRELPSLPATPETLAAFVDAMAKAKLYIHVRVDALIHAGACPRQSMNVYTRNEFPDVHPMPSVVVNLCTTVCDNVYNESLTKSDRRHYLLCAHPAH
jgi:hypothetical protein